MSRSKTVFVDPAVLEEAAVPLEIEDDPDHDPWGDIDPDKWRIKEVPPEGPMAGQLSEPAFIVDTGVGIVEGLAPMEDSESNLMLSMMADVCCCPGFQGEITQRTSLADLAPAKELPVEARHLRLVRRRTS